MTSRIRNAAAQAGLARLLAAVLALASGHAALATDYTESVSGDLSNDRLNPTRITLSYGSGGMPGNNIITGTIGSFAGVIDRDYLNVVVPLGFLLSELRLGNQTTVGGGGSFIGLAAGTVMPVAPDASSAAGLLGWRVYQLSDRNTDILEDMQTAGDGASGFERPLPAGDYTFWFQELAAGSYSYRFNMVLSPVPEPGSVALLALGLLVLATMQRRRAA